MNGSGDNDGVTEVNGNGALDDSKKNASRKKNFRGWYNQTWKRIRDGISCSCHKKNETKI